MILVGNQRGGAKDLAVHLMKDENDHVVVHELRGFASDDLMGALTEAYAVSRGTKCRQFLYSLSLNPPMQEQVSTEAFESAIERAEERMGLTGQPRAIVFHEKEGRRHAHVVWSRIRTDEMKAVQLSFTKRTLNKLSRELNIEHGWKMPLGLADLSQRDPRNFTHAEWQQAKRIGKDPRAIKAAFQDTWAISDSKASFIRALEERGFHVARGDRRGFVAVDVHGEVYSLARQSGVKVKALRERLGKEADLRSVDDVKRQLAQDMLAKMARFRRDVDDKAARRKTQFQQRKAALVQRQRAERENLTKQIEARQLEQAKTRQARFSSGLRGVWDRLSGKHKRIQEQNEREAYASLKQAQAVKDEIAFRHIQERQRLDDMKLQLRETVQAQRRDIRQDVRIFQKMASGVDADKKSASPKRRRSSPTAPRGPTPGD